VAVTYSFIEIQVSEYGCVFLMCNYFQKGDDTIPNVDFEFLLDGEFLRTSLLEHITSKGLSVVSTSTAVAC